MLDRPARKPHPGTELPCESIVGSVAQIAETVKFPIAPTFLVRGSSCTGVVTTPGTQTLQPSVLLVRDLHLRHFHDVLRSVAVVCEHGGKTSHLAVICRILGTPIAQLEGATDLFSPGDELTVDVVGGHIYCGQPQANLTITSTQPTHLLRGTPLDFQVAVVDHSTIARAQAVDQGDLRQFFLREEFLWIKHNISPFAFLAQHGPEAVANLLTAQLVACASQLKPRQLLNYRALDLRSDECEWADNTAALDEPNPQLGLHGTRRLLVEPSYLTAELLAVDALYDAGYDNVIFSLPFLTHEPELAAVLDLAQRTCRNAIKVGVFVETPSAVTELKYMVTGHRLAAVYIGTKDLTQTILACDRGSKHVRHIYDATCRPVVQAIQTVIDVCGSYNIPAFLFSLNEDLGAYLKSLHDLRCVSICCAEYESLVAEGHRGS